MVLTADQTVYQLKGAAQQENASAADTAK